MLTLLSPAKINLFLHITGRRHDGYHELQTLFQLLDYGDIMSFAPANTLTLDSDFHEVDSANNLVIKAATLLQQHTGCSQGAHISLDKRIPTGAGLGGGSSNAATTLLALNKLWNTQLRLDELAELGRQLGADVPVFVRGRTAWAEGIGEKLSPVEMPVAHYLVVYPNVHINTTEIFQHKELTRDEAPITLRAFLEQGASNNFEKVVRKAHKEVDKAMNEMAVYAPSKLTGSGSAAFSQFSSENDALYAYETLNKSYISFVASGVNISPVHHQLGLP